MVKSPKSSGTQGSTGVFHLSWGTNFNPKKIEIGFKDSSNIWHKVTEISSGLGWDMTYDYTRPVDRQTTYYVRAWCNDYYSRDSAGFKFAPDFIFLCMDTVSHPLVISASKEAKKHGKPRLSATALVLPGGKHEAGHLDLGANQLPADGSDVTIEVWATLRSVHSWARIFDYGPDEKNYFMMAWSYFDQPDAGDYQVYIVNYTDRTEGDHNAEIYISVEGWQIIADTASMGSRSKTWKFRTTSAVLAESGGQYLVAEPLASVDPPAR